jgi:anti-sigma B factor antagonist
LYDKIIPCWQKQTERRIRGKGRRIIVTIEKNIKDGKCVIALDGRLDTTTAPELEKELELDGISELVLDFTKLRYISSAGLRVILSTQKKINAAQGKMTIKNPNEMIMEVFEATGFSEILTIENE